MVEIILFTGLMIVVSALGIAIYAAAWVGKWHAADRKTYDRIIVEQKRAIRRLTRERNKWEEAAARAAGIRLHPPPKRDHDDQSGRRIVSPSEAIRREQQRRAELPTDTPPPPTGVENGVPPAVKRKFLADAKK